MKTCDIARFFAHLLSHFAFWFWRAQFSSSPVFSATSRMLRSHTHPGASMLTIVAFNTRARATSPYLLAYFSIAVSTACPAGRPLPIRKCPVTTRSFCCGFYGRGTPSRCSRARALKALPYPSRSAWKGRGVKEQLRATLLDCFLLATATSGVQ